MEEEHRSNAEDSGDLNEKEKGRLNVKEDLF